MLPCPAVSIITVHIVKEHLYNNSFLYFCSVTRFCRDNALNTISGLASLMEVQSVGWWRCSHLKTWLGAQFYPMASLLPWLELLYSKVLQEPKWFLQNCSEA